MPYLYVYTPDDFVAALPNETSSGYVTGTYPITLTLRPGAVGTRIEIIDTDAQPGRFDEVSTRQTIADPFTVGTVTYPAGTKIQGAYTLYQNANSTGLTVTSFRFGVDGYDSGAVQGIVATAPLVGGTSYVFRSGTTTNGHELPYSSYVACFVQGTKIDTSEGQVEVQNLTCGDEVWTADHGLQEIRWIGRRRVSSAELSAAPALRPVRIPAGALGYGCPTSDLMVSPQHRVLVRSAIAKRVCGQTEVLVAAKHLVGISGIEIATDVLSVDYFHILFDRHEIIFSSGAETESLYCGPGAMCGFDGDARQEIFTLFPELRDGARPAAARLQISGREARELGQRHVRHDRPLVLVH